MIRRSMRSRTSSIRSRSIAWMASDTTAVVARHQPAVIMIERRRLTPERHRAPRRAAAADRREHHVAADRGPGMADEAGDVREIPVVVAGQRHDDACVGLAGLGDGDAPAVSLEERAAFAQRERQRLARVAGRPQVLTEGFEKLEELEFP